LCILIRCEISTSDNSGAASYALQNSFLLLLLPWFSQNCMPVSWWWWFLLLLGLLFILGGHLVVKKLDKEKQMFGNAPYSGWLALLLLVMILII